MATEIKFTLKDTYTVAIWNPKLLKKGHDKQLMGEYFFSVIYSLYAQTNNKNEKIGEAAKKLLRNIEVEFKTLLSEIETSTEHNNQLLDKEPFIVDNSKNNPFDIVFTPQNNICTENAIFLKTIIAYDDYLVSLNQLKSLGSIDKNNYYKQRKLINKKLREIMERHSSISIKFHEQRKKFLSNSKKNKVTHD